MKFYNIRDMGHAPAPTVTSHRIAMILLTDIVGSHIETRVTFTPGKKIHRTKYRKEQNKNRFSHILNQLMAALPETVQTYQEQLLEMPPQS